MKIAIVNDVMIAVEAIRRALAAGGEHTIAWTARDGAEAVAKCARDTPDLVLMDLMMPVMDGVEATRRIMATTPCPILVVTGSMRGNSTRVYEALGAGALDVVQTPAGGPGAAMLLAKLEWVAKRLAAGRTSSSTPTSVGVASPAVGGAEGRADFLLGIGASAGGPAALTAVLAALPADLPAAVVIVQHIAEAFAPGLASWLEKSSRMPVRLATAGDRPTAGEVRVAAGDRHLTLDAAGRFLFTDEPAGHVYLPSIDVFFESMARYWRRGGAGVLLTGMGRDGAAGLLRLRQAGFPTVAQDRASSAVYGMPKAAAELGAAAEILPLPEIGPRLRSLALERAGRGSAPESPFSK